ncbi:MAG: hypothetical protein PVH96_05795 [Gemmatimonadota bacterium]|jgi:hypothetical protein
MQRIGATTSWLSTLSALALAGCGGAVEEAVSDSVTRLGQPTAAFAEDFGMIQTVREMPDGQVLVADPLGRALYLVDMDAGTRTQIGAEGEGPGEYLQPDAVWPLPGDSTLLVDLGNGRLVTLGPDLEFGPTMPLAAGEPGSPDGLILSMPQGVDGQGRIYVRGTAGFGREDRDSSAIVRLDRSTRAIDSVGTYLMQARIIERSGQGVSVSPIPLSPEDAWGVAPDGAIAVARASGYRLDWIGPDGMLEAGPPIPTESLPLGTPEKEEWDRERSRNAGLRVSISVGDQGVQTSFQRGAGGSPRGETDFDVYQWPETLPAVYSGRLPIDPERRAWVRRRVGAGGPPTYDVFGRDGARIATVELDPDRVIVGFGVDAIYVVAYDEFDLNYLERYAMPVLE